MPFLSVVLGFTFVSAAVAADTSPTEVTFYRDILPVLQKNCQECHRPGEAAPMALVTYKDVRPWARAIREAVLIRRMPPWFADPHVGRFTNDRSLRQNEIDILARWADTGAKEGDPKDAPPPRQFATGWIIGEPDAIFEMPEQFDVPATGTIEYTYFIVPTGFTEDRWIQMAECRPGNRSVVHHIIAFIRDSKSKWLREYPIGKAFVPRGRDRGREGGNEGPGGEFLSGFAPGAPPEMLRAGQAKLIKAGSDVVFQMHYTSTGKGASDRSRLGIIFAKQSPTHRVVTLSAANNRFVIPAHAPAHSVDGSITISGRS